MPCDADWTGVIGAGIGAFATLLGAHFTHYLQNKREASLDDKRRARLKALLAGKLKWRNLKTLAAAIGATDTKTAELLIEIDARASLTNSGSWALVSRAPWPEDAQPEE